MLNNDAPIQAALLTQLGVTHGQRHRKNRLFVSCCVARGMHPSVHMHKCACPYEGSVASCYYATPAVYTHFLPLLVSSGTGVTVTRERRETRVKGQSSQSQHPRKKKLEIAQIKQAQRGARLKENSRQMENGVETVGRGKG